MRRADASLRPQARHLTSYADRSIFITVAKILDRRLNRASKLVAWQSKKSERRHPIH
jgi:hypothetical protein